MRSLFWKEEFYLPLESLVSLDMASFEGSSITRPCIRVCRRYPGTLMFLGSINMACISSRDSFFRSVESQNHTPSDTACITTLSVLSPARTCHRYEPG